MPFGDLVRALTDAEVQAILSRLERDLAARRLSWDIDAELARWLDATLGPASSTPD